MANEKRLIDANAYLEQLARLVYGTYFDRHQILAVEECLLLLKNAPSMDAMGVVHGHWYKAPHHPYRCSCCGEEALLDMYGESHYRSNYCPNCGAKMDGDGNA